MRQEERETIFRWAADESTVSVWTAQPAVKRKLERAGYAPYKVSREGGEEVGWFYRVPLNEFRWRARAPRQVSPEQAAKRKAAGARLARLRVAPETTTNVEETDTNAIGGIS